jgi:transposase
LGFLGIGGRRLFGLVVIAIPKEGRQCLRWASRISVPGRDIPSRIRRRLRLLKNSFPARVLETVSRLALATSIEVWFRVGQKNSLVYQWAKKGSRPRQPKDQRYENAYLFGAVCPGRDTGVAIIMPYANTAAMRKHLEEISHAVAPGAHAMVILDQAGWHTTRKLKVRKNLTMVSLPPACPELNAAENIWQYLRQTYLSNRVFKSYTDILDACQEAWQKLLDETGRIASIATRDWAIIDQTI